MTTTILGVFDDPAAARRAMDDLRASALELEDTSIISRATSSGEAVSDDDHLTAGEGAVVGAVWGGLVGIAALLIPGIGPFIAGGAIFAALTGAAAGAVIGGVAGALIDKTGISEEDAQRYEQMVHQGKTLIAVKAREEDALEIRRILANDGAESIRDNQTDITSGGSVHVAVYDEAGSRVDEAAYGSPAAIERMPHSPNTVSTFERDGVVTGERELTDNNSQRRADEIEPTAPSEVTSYDDDPYTTRQVRAVPPQDVDDPTKK